MEPIAVVTAFVAVLYIVGRGGYAVAPAATVAFYRRVIFSTPGRIRTFGLGLLLLVAAPLIITARQAPATQTDGTVWLQALGWLAAVASIVIILAPGHTRRLVEWKFLGASEPVLRTLGVLGVAFGFFLGWVAFFVL